MAALFKASRSLKTTPLRCFVASETNDPRQRVVSQIIVGNNFLEYFPQLQHIIIFSTRMKSYFSNFLSIRRLGYIFKAGTLLCEYMRRFSLLI
jgi:hypothetical protein